MSVTMTASRHRHVRDELVCPGAAPGRIRSGTRRSVPGRTFHGGRGETLRRAAGKHCRAPTRIVSTGVLRCLDAGGRLSPAGIVTGDQDCFGNGEWRRHGAAVRGDQFTLHGRGEVVISARGWEGVTPTQVATGKLYIWHVIIRQVVVIKCFKTTVL